MKKRSILLLVLPCIFLLLVMFHKPIVCMAIKSHLQKKAPLLKNLSVNYDKACFDGHFLSFKNFKIANPKQHDTEIIKVEQFSVDFNFNPKRLSISPFLFAKGVDIHVFKSDYSIDLSHCDLYKTFSKVFASLKISIQEAKILCHDKDSDLAALHFEYLPGSKKEHLGKFHFYFDHQTQEDFPIVIDLYHSHKEILAKLKMNDLELYRCREFLEFFAKKPMAWVVNQGLLDGELHLGITTKNLIQYFKSDIQCSHFEALKKKRKDTVAFDVMKISAYLPLDMQRKLSITKLSLPQLIKDIAYSSDVTNGKYCFLNPATKSHWEIKNFHGKTHFNFELSPTVNFSGDMVKDGEEYPFDLTAKGLIESEKNWWLDLDLAMGKQNMKTHTNIFLTLLEDSTMYAKAFLKELSTSQLKMFQDLMQIRLPVVEMVSLEEIKLSTDLHLTIKSQEIKMLLFDHIKVSKLKALIKDKAHTCFTCDHLEGRVHLHFPLVSEIHSLFSNVDFKNVEVSQSYNNTRYNLSKASGRLILDKSCLKESFIEGVFEGVHSKIDLEGPVENLQLALTCQLFDKHLLSEFEKGVLKFSSELKPLKKVLAKLQLNLTEKPTVNGNVCFSYEDKPIEELKFNAFVSDYIGFIKGLKKSKFRGITGNFESDYITENTYLWALKAFDQKWETFGQMSFRGTFNEKTLKFRASSKKKVFYDSEDISVWVDASYDQPAYGDFLFDYKLLEWDVRIPLSRASVLDKKFSLAFDKVIADLKVKGTNLYAENISGFCENVYFQGVLDLDFKDPNWLKLNLYPKHAEGNASDFQRFLRHFPEFRQLDLPIEGTVKTHHHNFIQTCYNDVKNEQNSKYSFILENGTFDVSETAQFSNLNCEIAFDTNSGVLDIKDLKGDIDFTKTSLKKSYQLNFQTLHFHTKSDLFWDFDVRLESKTHDILRLVGKVNCLEKSFELDVDKDLSHFFNSKFSNCSLSLDERFEVLSFQVGSLLHLTDIGKEFSLLNALGLFSLSEEMITDIFSEQIDGNLSFAMDYNREKDQVNIEGFANHLSIGKFSFEDFLFHASKEKDRFIVNKCQSDKFKLFALAEKEKNIWNIPALDCSYEDIYCKILRGSYDTENAVLNFALKNLNVPLNVIKSLVNMPAYLEKLNGDISLSGDLNLDFSKGLSAIKTDLKLSSETQIKLDDDVFYLESKKPFEVCFNKQKCISINDVSVSLVHQEDQILSNTIEVKSLNFDLKEGSFSADKALLTIPPEMVIFLAKHGLVDSLQIKNDKFFIFGVEIPWDNQIKTETNITVQKGQVHLEGHLKDGYYWIGEKSVFLQNFHYQYENDKLTTIFGLDYMDFVLDIFARVDLKEKPYALISIKEGHLTEEVNRQSLDIHCKYSPEDGFFVQTVDGSIYGLDVSFHRNPRSYVPHVMILSGQMKIDSSGLVKAFPKLFYQTFKELGMGSGYELSGDWMISKKDLKSSYFKGFLKGRDFEFLGFQFKTLLSELDINTKQIQVREFSLSDQSGVMHVKDLRLAKSEEDGSWEMSIPEIVVQDFRPSFLKKYSYEQEQIKPFVIKDLHFFNIQGTLGYKDSFTGWGYMEFLNTFKREYNLLDIPIEIIGRIGFDLGLFVPIKGKVEFEMDEGKIFLKDLKNSYSDGKRSKFYLSSYKNSYIGLDGSIFVDIKMKQYVLLKITQPFTLSIRGSLAKPSYSLR